MFKSFRLTIFYTVIATMFFGSALCASATQQGQLRAGQEVLLTPQTHHALSVTRLGQNVGNFNFSILNNGDVIHQDSNQIDDIYLVFHDDVEVGDRILVHVNSGVFAYKVLALQTLPAVVKEVLNPIVFARERRAIEEETRQYMRQKEREKRLLIEQNRARERKAAAIRARELAKVKPLVASKQPVSKKNVLVFKKDPTAQSVTQAVAVNDIPQSAPVGENLLEKFTKIFESIVESFSFKPAVHAQKIDVQPVQPAKAVVSQKVVVKEEEQALRASGWVVDDAPVRRAPTQAQKLPSIPESTLPTQGTNKPTFSPSIAPRGVSTSISDQQVQNVAQVQQPQLTSPRGEIPRTIADTVLKQKAQREHNVFHQRRDVVVQDHIPTNIERKFSGTRGVAPVMHTPSMKSSTETIPRFSTRQTPQRQNPVLRQEAVPTFQATVPVSRASVVPAQETIPSFQVPAKRVVQARVNAPVVSDVTPAYPDTGYKEGYESLGTPKAQVPIVPTPEPVKPKVLAAVVHQRVVEDTTLPSRAVVSSQAEDKKLVITKIINKEEPKDDPYAGRVLGQMSDRVLGNGYDGDTEVGKLGMRVSKNSRPVSAWIEVFKDGTKQRVKTFYTSKTKSAKVVKLPKGTYMVRATYRTRDSKQQKTLNNVHIKEGGNVNKSIAFYDGTLRVVARRGDDALYVKVVAYKSGTHDRVRYNFSSRTSGIAEMTLDSGTYDIEVLDHRKHRNFDSVRIRGGKTETINADF